MYIIHEYIAKEINIIIITLLVVFMYDLREQNVKSCSQHMSKKVFFFGCFYVFVFFLFYFNSSETIAYV